jgi:DNA-binding protein
VNTDGIMRLSLQLAGLKAIPEDSEIYVRGREIRKVLFGIDAGVPELLLAGQMGYDAVIAHHPAGGTAATDFAQVFKRHVQQMIEAGVPGSEAERAVARKLEQLEVEAHTRNYNHAVDVARLLKIPYMNIHTPLDEVGRRIMAEQIKNETDENSRVQEVVAALNGLVEFKNAVTKIKIAVGKPENLAGRVVVSHGAGTNGGYEIARTYFDHGIRTVVYIHVGPVDLERLKADSVGNLIVTGHVASDSVGINPFIEELEKRGIRVTTVGVVPR